MKTQYTVGFAFNQSMDRVLLIRKNKPEWQKGLYNGIGGKVEEGETFGDCMRREFLEETGLDIPIWKLFAIMEGRNSEVNFYYCWLPDDILYNFHQATDEVPRIIKVSELTGRDFPSVVNLKWIVPMARTISISQVKVWKINAVEYDIE